MPGNTAMTEEGQIQADIHGILLPGSIKKSPYSRESTSTASLVLLSKIRGVANQTLWQTKAVYSG